MFPKGDEMQVLCNKTQELKTIRLNNTQLMRY